MVDGGVIGDVPGTHFINGLESHELPVIATYVHPTITPGFSYRVRPVDETRFLFKGQALTLQSVGKGYGKRITFNGDSKNQNDNFFYSDTNSSGYGFELQLLQDGDQFTIYDDSDNPVGEAVISKMIEPEIEIEHRIMSVGGILKKTKVQVQCEVLDYTSEGGVHQSRTVTLKGVAVAVRGKRSSASVKKLINCSLDDEFGFYLKSGTVFSNRPIIMSGAKINDVPTKYQITGVQAHEHPVVGTIVDPRIIPGFKYRVRPLDNKKTLFNNEALELQSIGRGYAKRFTFASNCKTYNDNYFWSDTNPAGYGFSIEAVCPCDTFSVIDDEGISLGVAQVYRADVPQIEESCEVSSGDIRKRVRVSVTCHLSLPGYPELTLPITGKAVLSKSGRGAAKIVQIEEIATSTQINLLFSWRGVIFVPM